MWRILSQLVCYDAIVSYVQAHEVFLQLVLSIYNEKTSCVLLLRMLISSVKPLTKMHLYIPSRCSGNGGVENHLVQCKIVAKVLKSWCPWRPIISIQNQVTIFSNFILHASFTNLEIRLIWSISDLWRVVPGNYGGYAFIPQCFM